MTGRNETLIRAMAVRAVTSSQLARTAGVGRSAVTHWRCGHRVPSRGNAARVAKLLGVTVAELWPGLAANDPAAETLAEQRARINRVAAAAGVTRQTVRSWLSGRHQPGPLALAALAANGLSADLQPRRPSRRNAGSDIRPLTVRELLALPTRHGRRWRERALCATSDNPDLWWPDDDDDPGAEARKICARCPVITACRDDFLDNPWPDRHCVVAGVWGQSLLTQTQRQRRKQQQTRKQAA